MEDRPPVSCFCLTYGRPRILEEAIHSFLAQDYAGTKELIVLNDYADQVLAFDHPEVRVVNLPRRFRTLGEKLNAAVALAPHDLLFVWDDDDIYLPHRLSFSVENFAPAKGFVKPSTAWVLNHGQLSGPAENCFHSASCWSRALFDSIRGYPADGSCCDQLFERQLAAGSPGSTTPSAVAPEEIYYIYRWAGTGSFHVSGWGAAQIGQNSGYAEAADFVRQRARTGEIPTGTVALTPHWETDYRQLVACQIAASNQGEKDGKSS